MIGRLLGGRYEILEKVGGGGMSLVYRARDLYLNRVVAIKVLREHLNSDEEFVTRFRKEAQAVASLSHINIVSIYDVGQEKDLHYLVMEMVEGQNLKEVIKEKGLLRSDDAVDIGKQICEALEHAHKHKIIHCDIKPHNIILTKEGRVKVTDFGIARAVTTATITHTGSIMGSVHYFSPEQAKGELADEKSDIYSMGVVLYEMMTGRLPYEGESPISVALNKINHDPVPPRELNPQIGEAMEKVILRAMDRNAARRYDAVHALKQDLTSAYLYNKLEFVPQEIDDTINVPVIPSKKKKKKELDAPVKVWLWVMAALIIFGFIFGMYLSATVLARGEATVPDILEKSEAEAKAILNKVELTLVVDKTVTHPTIQEGLVVSQDPKSEVVVKKRSEVKAVLSKGPQLVKVPNVLRSPLLNAEVALSNEGLTLGDVTRVYHEQIASGEVVHQEPAAGQEIIQGSAVNLIVSKGPEPIWIKMPQVTGRSVTQAETILKSYHLQIGVIQPEISYEYAKDVVLRQDPGADSEILQGSVVNLVVSAGPGPLENILNY